VGVIFFKTKEKSNRYGIFISFGVFSAHTNLAGGEFGNPLLQRAALSAFWFVQVWFQNSRARQKKHQQTTTTTTVVSLSHVRNNNNSSSPPPRPNTPTSLMTSHQHPAAAVAVLSAAAAAAAAGCYVNLNLRQSLVQLQTSGVVGQQPCHLFNLNISVYK